MKYNKNIVLLIIIFYTISGCLKIRNNNYYEDKNSDVIETILEPLLEFLSVRILYFETKNIDAYLNYLDKDLQNLKLEQKIYNEFYKKNFSNFNVVIRKVEVQVKGDKNGSDIRFGLDSLTTTSVIRTFNHLDFFIVDFNKLNKYHINIEFEFILYGKLNGYMDDIVIQKNHFRYKGTMKNKKIKISYVEIF